MTERQRTLGPTPERLKMAGDAVEVFTADENENWRAIRLLDDHVLEDLRSRGSVTADQYHAGMRFYSDWYLSGLANSGVIDPGRVVVDGGKADHLNDIKLSALNRWQKAVQALGLIQSQVLTDILLGEETLASYGQRRCGQRAPKLAKVAATSVLKHALDALDLYYYGQRKTKVRTAHAPDYRPNILVETEETSA